MSDNKVIEIQRLEEGLPGISPNLGRLLGEAFCICMFRNGHDEMQKLLVEGIENATYMVNWNNGITEQADNSWKDQVRATEWGAECLSILLALDLTDYTIIERSVTGTGFDYWLGSNIDSNGIYQNKARLEISGIFKGNRKEVQKREKLKIKQTNQSDDTRLPAYISIIEFSEPYARFKQK